MRLNGSGFRCAQPFNEIAALEGLSMKWENRVRLDVVRQNLLRMWSTT